MFVGVAGTMRRWRLEKAGFGRGNASYREGIVPDGPVVRQGDNKAFLVLAKAAQSGKIVVGKYNRLYSSSNLGHILGLLGVFEYF